MIHYFVDDIEGFTTNIHFCVTNSEGLLIDSELHNATKNMIYDSKDDILEEKCSNFTNYEKLDSTSFETDHELVNSTLEKFERNEEGRLIVPLIWNERSCHKIAKNYYLSKQILISTLKKLKKEDSHLKMVDDVFKDQLSKGIITEIDDLRTYIDDPEVSFISHMPIFKMSRESTKCRVVNLSNICEKGDTVDHNQAMLSGPTLNNKISTALTQLRFDKYILIFDLVKAFLQLELKQSDSKRLCFLWVKDIESENPTIIGYKAERLPFGLKCSPCLLMLALYHILMIDNGKDSEEVKNLKKSVYSMMYMDNGAISSNDPNELLKNLERLYEILNGYKFDLQQLNSNCDILNEKIGANCELPVVQKLLGVQWNTQTDKLSAEKLGLNQNAKTKREILSSIASNYDLIGMNGPLLNRARLYLHDLQCRKELGWDQTLDESKLKEWINISRQLNDSPSISIDRCIGRRDGEFDLVAFTDSSKEMYGTVLYMMDKSNNESKFLYAKNRIVNKSKMDRSIPSLELEAILLGVECLCDTVKELSGETAVVPIKIDKLILCTDSQICLNWINSASNKLAKMNKQTVFVQNRINKILKFCDKNPIQFMFCEGSNNPSDKITRPNSYKLLIKSNYIDCDVHSIISLISEDLKINVPNTNYEKRLLNVSAVHVSEGVQNTVLDVKQYSEFWKVFNAYRSVLKCISVWKSKLVRKNPTKYAHFSVKGSNSLIQRTYLNMISMDQCENFGEIFSYLSNSNAGKMPELVSRLNIFKDKNNILRVKHKIKSSIDESESPILMSKNSYLTGLLIMEVHRKLFHSGIYAVMRELRKKYWVPQMFSLTRKLLKKCVHCKRLNNRTVEINQSPYRDFRISPPNIPFRTVFIDHIGPFTIYYEGQNARKKVYLLIFTCLWSRAINLVLCRDLTVNSFIKAYQTHTYSYGVPTLCVSDQGSTIIGGTGVIKEFLNDKVTQEYFELNGIKNIEFQQYPRGRSELGGVVESCVKIVKRLIFGAIRNLILNYFDFEFLIQQVIHLANRRPIALKSAIRAPESNEDWPSAITPEILLKGYELVSVDLVPSLHLDVDLEDLPYNSSSIDENCKKLLSARKHLADIYNSEFLSNLDYQATNVSNRYKPVSHQELQENDVILLKEPLIKPNNFPMARILQIVKNDMGETTEVIALKGKTRERVRRHVTSVIPYLRYEKDLSEQPASQKSPLPASQKSPLPASQKSPLPASQNSPRSKRQKRVAAVRARKSWQNDL